MAPYALTSLTYQNPLTFHRPISCHGTGISPGHTSKLWEMSVATLATNHTGTGARLLSTQSTHQFSMAQIILCQEMVSTRHTTALMPCLPAWIVSHRDKEVDVLRLDLSRSISTPLHFALEITNSVFQYESKPRSRRTHSRGTRSRPNRSRLSLQPALS